MVVDTAIEVSPETRSFLSRLQGARIGDAEVFAASGETFDTVDPATEETVATVTASGAQEADLAVRTARAAFEDGRWSSLRPAKQGDRLLALADLIEANATQLAELDVLDLGMPWRLAAGSVQGSAALLRYYAGWPTKIEGSVSPGAGGMFSFVQREPIGVCAAITPWNAPLDVAVGKLAPALACGNTVVIKPAEQTPLSALRLGELCLEAGIPSGVVSILPGLGEAAGAALVDHPGVDKVAFTGSTEVGRLIQVRAAATLKRVTLELGGKSPNVIFADADIEKATSVAAVNIWANAGQTCFAGTRVLVQREVLDEVTEALTERFTAVKVGPGLDRESQMGPLVSAEQLARVNGYIALGKKEGAVVRTGGGQLDRRGYFVEPTIFTGVDNSMRIAREEIFGPVLSVIPFDTEQDAVELANDTPYGLGAGVWTRDLSRALHMSRAIRSGVVWVNTFGVIDHGMPFGGYKQSGYGREFGAASLDAYTELKSVYVRL